MMMMFPSHFFVLMRESYFQNDDAGCISGEHFIMCARCSMVVQALLTIVVYFPIKLLFPKHFGMLCVLVFRTLHMKTNCIPSSNDSKVICSKW